LDLSAIARTLALKGDIRRWPSWQFPVNTFARDHFVWALVKGAGFTFTSNLLAFGATFSRIA